MAILSDFEKKTAGQLHAILTEHCSVSPGIGTALQDVLVARNRLVHRFLIDNVERLLDPTDRGKVVKEIRRLRSKVQKGQTAIHPFVVAFNKALDGVDHVHETKKLMETIFGD